MVLPSRGAIDSTVSCGKCLLGSMGRVLVTMTSRAPQAASRSAAAMAATAGQVVAMERAAGEAPDSQAYLAPTINAFTAQLNSGVRQYNEMVTAAAQLVSSVNAGSFSPSQQRYRSELSDATDRLLGWAQAFEELDQLR